MREYFSGSVRELANMLKNSQSAVISMNVIIRYRFGIRSTFRSASDVDISKVNHWGSREVVLPK